MDVKTKLLVLNNMEVVETDGDGECLYYVLVLNSEENRAELKHLGFPDSELSECEGEDFIDISVFAFEQCGAEWYQSDLGGFIDYVPQQ
ncbi:hypothetical protein [Paenibacillus sp. UMB4589-SE434]|uniref:hypothetical protein n=1 Tax=Paenibacillus sp. UMB4589-SE434 TaxID=3046314 RepID=UPI00254C4398|nr:hypothetical protein [Paenibacillus sp. UMB4589-SE434]MDK8182087.1 hypothetical protein [Paenibacillus sp. UMB4589-SE434]